MDYSTFVGLDVHKDTIAVAVAKEGTQQPVSLGLIPNTQDSLLKLLKKLVASVSKYCFVMKRAFAVTRFTGF